MKDLKEWVKNTEQGYSRLYTVINDIVQNKQEIEQVYAQIDKKLASIKNTLEKNEKQSQSIIKVKKSFWSRGEKNTVAGHVESLGKKLESKFVTDTDDLCERVCQEFFSFDLRMLGEFLKFHRIDCRKKERTERESCFEEFVRLDPANKPCFYNVRRNMIAMLRQLAAEK